MSTIAKQAHVDRESQAHANRSNETSHLPEPGNQQPSEGYLTQSIEQQTAKLPSDTWLLAAGGSIALSMFLQATGQKQKSLFVGNWAPTFLLLGIYNKMVKQHGSE
ncbi:hypothetical protein [Crateriforma spongiae]|uniref:hypothetical protein n=1 Tax=Crateriforma spongiae TaxID=2724528 RepID=UPI001F23D486|nr:hypothetical protein [Crateriforma spongiae]